MATGNLDVSPRDTALILNGLLELTARLDGAQEVAARNGDVAGLIAIDDNREAIRDLYDRVRSRGLGDIALPSLLDASQAAA